MATLPKPSSDSTVTVRFSGDDDALPPRFEVAYWGIRGLGAPLRMMMCATRTDFVCHLYYSIKETDTAWTSSYFTDKEKFAPDYPFMNLPFLIDAKEHLVVTQTNACLQYLGEQLNLMGQSMAERALCVQLLCEIYDLRNVMVAFAYRGKPDQAASASTIAVASKHFGKFDRHFASKEATGDAVFTVGNSMTAPDFHLFEMIDQFIVLGETFGHDDCLKEYPHVRAFYTSFAKLEANQFYLTSLLHKDLPMNSPYAQFGSVPCGTSETPWRKLGATTLQGPPPSSS